jgi:hypothetical protein
MTSFLIVEKTGNIKEVVVKKWDESELYKKAGFKNAEGFVLQTTWSVELKGRKFKIQLYAKKSGRAGQENKYEFPPPVDSSLFFGNCLLVNLDNDLKLNDWTSIYEHLYGGFEDIGSEDSEDEDEDVGDVVLTKEGYAKDGFIVDDDDDEDGDFEDEDDDDFDDDESSEDAKPKRKVKKTVKNNKKTTKPTKPSKSTKKNDNEPVEDNNVESVFLNCQSELEEEEYV